MRSVLNIVFLVSCLGFVVVFNMIGEQWDMGGYDPNLDVPLANAYTKPRLQSESNAKAIFFEGQELILNTVAIGGDLKYKWYFNDEPINGANDNILILFGAQISNSGTYKLVATNKYGSAELTHQVEVKSRTEIKGQTPNSPPEILYYTGGGQAILGKAFTIAVTATGDNIKYRWFKNGKLIVNANSRRLIFLKFKRTDAAKYHVEVKNDFGVVKRNMFVGAEREANLVGDS